MAKGTSAPKWVSGDPATLKDVQDCVGPGWGELVERAYRILEGQQDPIILQVKEKFGGLRFYHAPDCPEIYEIEQESFAVCERCGGPGEATGKHWIKTLCEECAND